MPAIEFDSFDDIRGICTVSLRTITAQFNDLSLSVELETSLSDQDVQERLEELAKILSAGIQLDHNMTTDISGLPTNRLRAIAALEVVFQTQLMAALDTLHKTELLWQGRIEAAEVGFPEFNDDASDSQFD